MMTTTSPLVEDYLARLDRAARALDRAQRAELLAEIRSHVEAGLTATASEADVRNLLDELGTPEEIVAAARPEQPTVRRGLREVLALVLLVIGLPPILGWIAGVVLLLWSPLWSGRQKLLGILVWPGGLGAGVLALGVAVTAVAPSCPARPVGTPGSGSACGPSSAFPYGGLVLIALVVVAQLAVGAYLYRAAGRRSAPA